MKPFEPVSIQVYLVAEESDVIDNVSVHFTQAAAERYVAKRQADLLKVKESGRFEIKQCAVLH